MTQPALVEPTFLMFYPGGEIDYRPVVDPTGQYVIFERTIKGNCNLYILDLATTARVPTPYVPSVDGSSRPDWSKALGVVAFCNKDGIWFTQGTGGTDPWLLSETSNMIYPAWYPSGKNLLVMNNQQSTTGPSPRTTKILDDGSIAQQVMANGKLWGGEPSVNPVNPAQYVFAGQLIAGQTTYNEDLNYIWLVDASTKPETIRPLDQKTPTGGFNSNFQGRAPWWSPDGKWVAFESNRLVPGTEGYAIYIQDSAGASAPMQVLDTGWSGNHAKWFPSGTELVVSVLQIPGIFWPSPHPILPPAVLLRGIAKLDVSAFVGNAGS
jgi:Tol biopolymer transport system component